MTENKTWDSTINWGRLLVIIAAVWAVLWIVVPAATISNDYIDFLENVVWGRHLQFGYDKHPPFCVVLSRGLYEAGGGSFLLFYAASQCCVAIALWSVWNTGIHFLSPARTFPACVILLLTPYYSSSITEFNNDAVLLAAWALSGHLLYRALKTGRVRYYLFLGLVCGLAMSTKYFSAVWFAGLFTAMLITKEGRAAFRTAGPYLALATGLLIWLPNLIWLVRHDFISIQYAMGGANPSNELGFLAKRGSFAIQLLVSQAGHLAATGIPFLLIFFGRLPLRANLDLRRDWKQYLGWSDHPELERRLIPVLTFWMLAACLTAVLIGGIRIKQLWMTPAWSFLGLFLVMFARPVISRPRVALFLAAIAGFGLLNSAIFSCKLLYDNPYGRKHPNYNSFPGRALAADLTARWHDRFGRPLSYVVAGRREACNFAVYSSDRPEALFSGDPKLSPWIDPADVQKKGGVIYWECDDQAPSFVKNYRTSPMETVKVERAHSPLLRRLLGTPKAENYGYVFILPDDIPDGK